MPLSIVAPVQWANKRFLSILIQFQSMYTWTECRAIVISICVPSLPGKRKKQLVEMVET